MIKQPWKRLFAGILAASMLWTVPGLPVAAQSLEWQSISDETSVLADESAAQTVSYLDENGQMQTVEAMPLPKSGSNNKLAAGWYIAEGTDFDRYTFYSISTDVKLILANGCKVELINEISVSGFMGGKLAIYAQSEDPAQMGELIVTTSESSSNPAIGNSSGAGDITINGGKITVTSHKDAAAIGSGKGKPGGNITINGGIIQATAVAEAGKAGGGAAIGGGSISGGNGGDGGKIVINGGTVTAIAQSGGAGIGGGGGSGSTGTRGGNGGSITINGGTVYAESTNGGAGIGGGSGSNGGSGGSSGNILITGGEVTAISSAIKIGAKSTYKGAGIGSGHSGLAAQNSGTIEITGGRVTATGGGEQNQSGAGIGGSYQSTGGTIRITGGTVMATRGYPANAAYADIGAGSGAADADIQISGGSVCSSTGHAKTSNTPTNDIGVPVYSTVADLNAVYGPDKLVTDAVVDGYDYGFDDVYTGSDGKIYMYLSESAASANFNGAEYEGTVTANVPNELKKVGLTLKAEVSDVTPATAVLNITATPGSTVYYVASDVVLSTPEAVKDASGSQSITVDATGSGQIDLTGLVYGNTYHYYLVAEQGSKFSEVELVVVTPAAISLENARIELDNTEFVYDGTEHKPKVSVYLDDNTVLNEGTDYTVSYENSSSMSNNTVDAETITVTVTGTGKYSGTAAEKPTYVIAQKPVTAQIEGTVSKDYDGSTEIKSADGLTIVIQGLVQNDVVTATAEKYTYDTADVGETKAVVAHNVTLSGADAGNYCLTGEVRGMVGSIKKSTPGFEFNPYGEKIYDGNPMPIPSENELFITNGGRYQDIKFQWYMADGVTPLENAPVDAGEYVLEVSLEATANTNEASARQPILINKAEYEDATNVNGFVIPHFSGSIALPPVPEEAVYVNPETTETSFLEDLQVKDGFLYYAGTDQLIEGHSYFVNIPVTGAKNYRDYMIIVSLTAKNAEQITVNMDQIVLNDKTYDGQPLRYTGEAFAEGYNGLFTYEWYDAQGNLMTDAPVNAGSYILRATASASDVAGMGEKYVVIRKASVTIKADNKVIYTGDKLPELTYTVSGLVAGDTLTKQPTVLCSGNITQPGHYVITVSGADAGSNYNIVYESGVLTVLESSGGINPPAPTPDPDPIPVPDPDPIPNPNPKPSPTDSNWVKDKNGWRYYESKNSYLTDQWKYLDSEKGYYAWYWFDRDGYVTTGWQKIDNVWYYMNDFGAMQTGWQLVDGKWYYLSGSGAMKTGWQLVDGKWYYLSGSGA